eukprot:6188436-Pleurochrysis_carterae.AAC.2
MRGRRRRRRRAASLGLPSPPPPSPACCCSRAAADGRASPKRLTTSLEPSSAPLPHLDLHPPRCARDDHASRERRNHQQLQDGEPHVKNQRRVSRQWFYCNISHERNAMSTFRACAKRLRERRATPRLPFPFIVSTEFETMKRVRSAAGHCSI